jgi:hypothetical protein
MRVDVLRAIDTSLGKGAPKIVSIDVDACDPRDHATLAHIRIENRVPKGVRFDHSASIPREFALRTTSATAPARAQRCSAWKSLQRRIRSDTDSAAIEGGRDDAAVEI